MRRIHSPVPNMVPTAANSMSFGDSLQSSKARVTIHHQHLSLYTSFVSLTGLLNHVGHWNLARFTMLRSMDQPTIAIESKDKQTQRQNRTALTVRRLNFLHRLGKVGHTDANYEDPALWFLCGRCRHLSLLFMINRWRTQVTAVRNT